MLGLVLAATCIVTTLRVIKARTMFGLATPIDLGFSGLLVWLFHGTLAGMVGAATGGLALAVFLTCGRWIVGYNKPKVVRTGRFSWKYTEQEVRSPVFGWIKDKIAAVHANAMQRVNS